MSTISLYGKNPIIECLSHQKGRDALVQVCATREALEDVTLHKALEAAHVHPRICDRFEIEKMAGKDTVHQGVVATVTEEKLYTDFHTFLSQQKSDMPSLLCLLDNIEDPHNVGAIIRSAKAFGASAVIIPTHDGAGLTAAAVKTASGMNFSLPIIRISSVITAIKKLKEARYWIYSLLGEGEELLTKTEFDERSVIIIGNEGRGVREKTRESSDFLLRIPLDPQCESLNASVAAAVTLFEYRRQHPFL